MNSEEITIIFLYKKFKIAEGHATLQICTFKLFVTEGGGKLEYKDVTEITRANPVQTGALSIVFIE
jgi:hypothetical protein